MNSILRKIEAKLINKNIIITNKYDTYYLTSFKSSNLIIFFINNKWYAGTDSRYIEEAKKSIEDMYVIDISKKGWFNKVLDKNEIKEIYLNEPDTTITMLKSYKKSFEKYDIDVKTTNYGWIRNETNNQIIDNLKKSSKINDEIFIKLKKQIKVGMSEKEIKNILLKLVIDSEADEISFDPIVAAGTSTSNPHWTASEKILEPNELLTIDAGVFYNSYASDMTRTFVPQGSVSIEEEKIWKTVKKALDESTKLIKAGVLTKDLYNVANNIINDAGYKGYFNHALGHGLGLEVHDSPNLSPMSNEILSEGMVITIEPGIYIPEKYGVRLENAILVKKDGYEILNNSKIELYEKK